MTDVDDAMHAITKACGADAEIIFGANYGPETMKDSIAISVIATCFKETEADNAAPSIAEEIIGSPANDNSFASYLGNSNKGFGADDSGFSDLEAIFKKRS